MAIELSNDAIPSDIQLYNPENYPISYSGLGEEYISQIMGAVLPQLTQSVQNYDANVDQYTAEAMGLAQNTGQNLLQDVLQTNLNSMVQRGMVNSKVAGTTMGAATGDVLTNVQNQMYQAGMQAAEMKLGETDMLSQLASLGEYSMSEDPSVPDRIIATLFSGTI